MSGVELVSLECLKDLGVIVTSNLKSSQHCKDAPAKANTMLGFISRNFPFRNIIIILP